MPLEAADIRSEAAHTRLVEAGLRLLSGFGYSRSTPGVVAPLVDM